MNKDYLKPDVEYISLVAQEKVTSEDDGGLLDGEMGLESNTDF